ncbi:unnamed protein product, partial [Prorocentrum cordatum]
GKPILAHHTQCMGNAKSILDYPSDLHSPVSDLGKLTFGHIPGAVAPLLYWHAPMTECAHSFLQAFEVNAWGDALRALADDGARATPARWPRVALGVTLAQ